MNGKVRHIAGNIIIVCLIGIMLVCFYEVYKAYKEFSDNLKSYEEIKRSEIDFDELKKVNPDVKAWIKYEDTQIDYPVVMGEDNDYYLHHRFDKTYDDHGSIFIDAATRDPFKQFNTIVYGHRMRDGSMFNNLKYLTDKAYAKEHPKLALYTPEGKYDLLVWAVLNKRSDNPVYRTNVPEGERKGYIKDIKADASYLMDIPVNENSTLVILSTCVYTDSDERLIIVCRMVESEDTSESVMVPLELSTWERIKLFLKGLLP